MQKGVQTDATCNIQKCWELLANNVASVCTGLKGLHPSLNWERKKLISVRVFIFMSSKQRRLKRLLKEFTSWSCTAKKCTKKRATHAKICCLTFKTFCFLTLFLLLFPSSLLMPPCIIDVCKLLGIPMRF